MSSRAWQAVLDHLDEAAELAKLDPDVHRMLRIPQRMLEVSIPVRLDDGSTASTATLRPWPVRKAPRVSMVVDLPTPGAPVMPTRMAWPVRGSSSCTSRCAVLW